MVTASCLKVQQMALVNNLSSILPPNFLSISDSSAICMISSENRYKKRIESNCNITLP